MYNANCQEENEMQRLIWNPYLPEGTFIPDGEPHVFGNRLYVYGSHDKGRGMRYCPGDYQVWSENSVSAARKRQSAGHSLHVGTGLHAGGGRSVLPVLLL